MGRINLYIDVDGVVYDSTKAMTEWYREKYYYHEDYVDANPSMVKDWNGQDQMPLLQGDDIITLFNSPYFFQVVEIKPYAQEVLWRLHETGKFNISFCSIGTALNISQKILHLKKHFPYITNYQMIVQEGEASMGKGDIIQDGIILDDHKKNLTCAKHNILFKDDGDKEWNKGFDGLQVSDWLGFEHVAIEIARIDMGWI